jgi:3-dehydroquinate synthase
MPGTTSEEDMMKQVLVRTRSQSYPALIGVGLSNHLNRLLKKHVSDGRLFVFIDANVFALYGKRFLASISIKRHRRLEFVVPSGEGAKSASVLSGLYDFLLDHQISRDDFILAVGGGVTSDLAGYAAASVLRGVRWGVVPTTLLSMADASIGGKTGINHQRGKNLIGAFWQPMFVCSDVNFLMTLPERHMIAGLGEIAKAAGLSGSDAVRKVQEFLNGGELYGLQTLTCLIHTAVSYKATIVSGDEREAGMRRVLNFGHTFAHGIERALVYKRLLHGEAVIVGIAAALALGESLGYRSAGLQEYRRTIETLMGRLPVCKIALEQVIEAMRFDKKRSGAAMRFVLLERVGRPVIRERVSASRVRMSVEVAIRHYQSVGGGHA